MDNSEWAIMNEKSVSGGIAGVKYEGDSSAAAHSKRRLKKG
jgi:hypothetical protein